MRATIDLTETLRLLSWEDFQELRRRVEAEYELRASNCDLLPEELSLFQAGKKLECIKLVRLRVGGLVPAKAIVDAYEAKQKRDAP